MTPPTFQLNMVKKLTETNLARLYKRKVV